MKRHSKTQKRDKQCKPASKMTPHWEPSEVDAETLRHISGGPDLVHPLDPLEP
ncbi:MAG TPA: hypothetical protein VNM90_20275 [Haliangium sp.]|nr:hypothetical protein [Haliangium sp.]